MLSINELNQAASTFFLVVSIVNFILGSIGLLVNVIVFTRPILRREPCSLYFLISSCYNLFVVFIVMPTRVLSNSYSISLSNLNDGICKFEYFIFYATRATSIWLILLACIDRFLHSSSKESIRRISTLKTAKISILITSLIVPILYSHMLFYYEIANVTNQYGKVNPQCNGQKGFYRTFFGFCHMVVYSICPTLFMLLFGFLTLRNVRQHRQIVRRFQENSNNRRTDSQLLRMLATQVIVIIIATLPFSLYQLYTSFTTTISKSTYQVAQDNLAARITGIMTYFAHSTSFYLYTLTGSIFRNEVYKIIHRRSRLNRNHINPMDTGPRQTLPQKSLSNQRITTDRNI